MGRGDNEWRYMNVQNVRPCNMGTNTPSEKEISTELNSHLLLGKKTNLLGDDLVILTLLNTFRESKLYCVLFFNFTNYRNVSISVKIDKRESKYIYKYISL